jgi:2-polyprenyl-3-methyl-5-hydroxy-6-metoxy-1,4-benzoquinol methylase
MNKKQADEFWSSRTNVQDAREATHFNKDDKALDYEVSLIKKYIPPMGRILDLGCGTCTLTNLLTPFASYIRGVEKQQDFLRFCTLGPNSETVVADVASYKDNHQYDVILIFGVLNYIFDDDEVRKIYQNCANMLAPNGHLIVKHQSGVDESVEINKFSEDIGANYLALYRQKERDEGLLKEFFNVETIDIYPPKMNRWTNTHFYAYVAST